MAEHSQSHNGAGGHEHRDTDARIIVYSALGLVVAMVLVCLFVVALFKGMQQVIPADRSASRLVNPTPLPPAPRLQEHPAIEYRELRRREDDALNHYGWVDQKAGVVRIPIDKAIDIMAQRGFPTRSGQVTGNANSTSK
ncbi:MAG TPA: hypothetical protein VMJ34_12170 [Bryobacteraceae bacterium]|nr:hypothetical protein [Bryobacteraceae bacterium]